MKISTAVIILEYHNKWRRDNTGELVMPKPKSIGIAFDTVLEFVKGLPQVLKASEYHRDYTYVWEEDSGETESQARIMSIVDNNYDLSANYYCTRCPHRWLAKDYFMELTIEDLLYE